MSGKEIDAEREVQRDCDDDRRKIMSGKEIESKIEVSRGRNQE